MKYIIKNCPATFQNIGDEYVCPSVCRQEGFPVYCENTTNCLLKRIVELCKEKIEFCKKCSEKADLVYDCVDCNEGGEAHFARAIISNLLEIEEADG